MSIERAIRSWLFTPDDVRHMTAEDRAQAEITRRKKELDEIRRRRQEQKEQERRAEALRAESAQTSTNDLLNFQTFHYAASVRHTHQPAKCEHTKTSESVCTRDTEAPPAYRSRSPDHEPSYSSSSSYDHGSSSDSGSSFDVGSFFD